MTAVSKHGRSFLKMHGLGNDFVVLDARTQPLDLSVAAVRAIADRRTGVGFDQLVTLQPSARADVFMGLRNADGSVTAACGNATRCVARLLMDETGRDSVTIETLAGLLRAEAAPGGLVTVNMGQALLHWDEIPLARAADTNHLPLAAEDLTDPVGLSMGNPHAVFFVPDAQAVPLERLGPLLEHDPLFPERCNIEVAQILSPERIRMRVWERGTGITQACGTGACATLVAAARRGLTGRRAEIVLDGGSLIIEWLDNGEVLMTGPAALAYSGTLDPSLLL
jgi:diaminopimelate epimerase